MSIAKSLERLLNGRGISYEILEHERTISAAATADVCSISKDNMAKGVLVKRKTGYLLAIVPASTRVALNEIGEWLDEPVGLATKGEVESIFPDCDKGAIPLAPSAYGLSSVLDDSLEGLKDIYFDGGDHCSLVHVRGREFHKMLHDVPHAHIASCSP